jgi:hypothetical protein
MTSSTYNHLLACGQRYAQRAANPVVAWDCIGAKTWAGRCETLAGEILDMTEQDALAHLIRRRDHDSHRSPSKLNTSPWAFLVTIDLVREMDTIVDPIAREHRGWVEVTTTGGLDNGKMSIRPAYRRMLGINHCVSYCGRERDESDQAWQERRVAWLSQYHPNIHVTCRDHGYGWGLGGGQCTSLLGTVREFAEMSHAWFNRDTCVACDLSMTSRRTQPNVASYSTECGPVCGVCHRERVPQRHLANDGLEAMA